MLIVAGTGRNVGKTSFVCYVIERISKTQDIISVKISPHFHEISPTEKLISKSENYEIVEELDKDGAKDSSRMLNAGASRVFYVQTQNDEAIVEVIEALNSFWLSDMPIICESGGLRHFIDPGLFFVCKSKAQPEMKPHLKALESKVDQFVLFQGNEFDFEMGKLKFTNKKWLIEKSH